MQIEVAHINSCTQVLGPGMRYVIWVQGCSNSCNGCIAPEFKALGGGRLMNVENLAQEILENSDLDGLTISGGEPFLQSTALNLLICQLKRESSSLNYIIYTGYELEELTQEQHKALINNVDLIISGPYIHELNNNRSLAGSTNQTFHYISDKLIPFKKEIESGIRNIELEIKDKELIITGVPDIQVLEFINQNY